MSKSKKSVEVSTKFSNPDYRMAQKVLREMSLKTMELSLASLDASLTHSERNQKVREAEIAQNKLNSKRKEFRNKGFI